MKDQNLFLEYSALDITANCIYKIHYLALDGFYFNTAHKLNSKEKAGIRTRGCWVGSKNASSVLRGPSWILPGC